MGGQDKDGGWLSGVGDKLKGVIRGSSEAAQTAALGAFLVFAPAQFDAQTGALTSASAEASEKRPGYVKDLRTISARWLTDEPDNKFKSPKLMRLKERAKKSSKGEADTITPADREWSDVTARMKSGGIDRITFTMTRIGSVLKVEMVAYDKDGEACRTPADIKIRE